jgi:hypothetical protein
MSVEVILLLSVLLLCAPLLLVLLRGLYCFLFRPGKGLVDLATVYPRSATPLPELSRFRSARLPAMTDLATAVGFGPEGMTVTHDVPFASGPELVVPWQNLRVDLDFGLLVVVEVVPERTQFLLLLGAITRDQVRQIREAGTAPSDQ